MAAIQASGLGSMTTEEVTKKYIVAVLGGGVNVLNGNKTNVSAILPVSLTNTNILSGILGDGCSHGAAATKCDCREGIEVPSQQLRARAFRIRLAV
ncbi:hypothetical protein [Bradyrhizobium sp. USDA 3364]